MHNDNLPGMVAMVLVIIAILIVLEATGTINLL